MELAHDSLTRLTRGRIGPTLSQQLVLAPRPKNSVRFSQALAQLEQEFQISQKPSSQKLLEQLEQQKKMFDIEISQQRHELRENTAEISEKREKLKNIVTQLHTEYESIKTKNQNILNLIVSQEDFGKIKTLTACIAEKIKNKNYIPSRTDDTIESFDILYPKYNVKRGKEKELKKKFEEDCIRANRDQQISVLRNGFIGHYDQLTDILQILLMDLSNPKSQWKMEKQKRETLHHDLRDTFLAIQNIENTLALLQSQAEEREKKITYLMLQKQRLLNYASTNR